MTDVISLDPDEAETTPKKVLDCLRTKLMGNLRGDETPMETGELTKEHLVVAEEEEEKQVCLVVLGRKGGGVIESEEEERFMIFFC